MIYIYVDFEILSNKIVPLINGSISLLNEAINTLKNIIELTNKNAYFIGKELTCINNNIEIIRENVKESNRKVENIINKFKNANLVVQDLIDEMSNKIELKSNQKIINNSNTTYSINSNKRVYTFGTNRQILYATASNGTSGNGSSSSSQTTKPTTKPTTKSTTKGSSSTTKTAKPTTHGTSGNGSSGSSQTSKPTTHSSSGNGSSGSSQTSKPTTSGSSSSSQTSKPTTSGTSGNGASSSPQNQNLSTNPTTVFISSGNVPYNGNGVYTTRNNGTTKKTTIGNGTTQKTTKGTTKKTTTGNGTTKKTTISNSSNKSSQTSNSNNETSNYSDALKKMKESMNLSNLQASLFMADRTEDDYKDYLKQYQEKEHKKTYSYFTKIDENIKEIGNTVYNNTFGKMKKIVEDTITEQKVRKVVSENTTGQQVMQYLRGQDNYNKADYETVLSAAKKLGVDIKTTKTGDLVDLFKENGYDAAANVLSNNLAIDVLYKSNVNVSIDTSVEMKYANTNQYMEAMRKAGKSELYNRSTNALNNLAQSGIDANSTKLEIWEKKLEAQKKGDNGTVQWCDVLLNSMNEFEKYNNSDIMIATSNDKKLEGDAKKAESSTTFKQLENVTEAKGSKDELAKIVKATGYTEKEIANMNVEQIVKELNDKGKYFEAAQLEAITNSAYINNKTDVEFTGPEELQVINKIENIANYNLNKANKEKSEKTVESTQISEETLKNHLRKIRDEESAKIQNNGGNSNDLINALEERSVYFSGLREQVNEQNQAMYSQQAFNLGLTDSEISNTVVPQAWKEKHANEGLTEDQMKLMYAVEIRCIDINYMDSRLKAFIPDQEPLDLETLTEKNLDAILNEYTKPTEKEIIEAQKEEKRMELIRKRRQAESLGLSLFDDMQDYEVPEWWKEEHKGEYLAEDEYEMKLDYFLYKKEQEYNLEALKNGMPTTFETMSDWISAHDNASLSDEIKSQSKIVGASAANSTLALTKGVANFAGDILDGGTVIGTTVLTVPMALIDEVIARVNGEENDFELTRALIEQSMEHVEKNYVDDAANWLYENSDTLKAINDNSAESFKNGNTGYQVVEVTGELAAAIATGKVLTSSLGTVSTLAEASSGGTELIQTNALLTDSLSTSTTNTLFNLSSTGKELLLTNATIGFLHGTGSNTDDYLSKKKEEAGGEEWKTLDNAGKALIQGYGAGALESTLAGIGTAVNQWNPTSSSLKNAALRVIADGATVFVLDQNTRAVLDSITEDISVTQAWENRGGNEQNLKSTLQAMAISAGSEAYMGLKNNSKLEIKSKNNEPVDAEIIEKNKGVSWEVEADGEWGLDSATFKPGEDGTYKVEYDPNVSKKAGVGESHESVSTKRSEVIDIDDYEFVPSKKSEIIDVDEVQYSKKPTGVEEGHEIVPSKKSEIIDVDEVQYSKKPTGVEEGHEIVPSKKSEMIDVDEVQYSKKPTGVEEGQEIAKTKNDIEKVSETEKEYSQGSGKNKREIYMADDIESEYDYMRDRTESYERPQDMEPQMQRQKQGSSSRQSELDDFPRFAEYEEPVSNIKIEVASPTETTQIVPVEKNAISATDDVITKTSVETGETTGKISADSDVSTRTNVDSDTSTSKKVSGFDDTIDVMPVQKPKQNISAESEARIKSLVHELFEDKKKDTQYDKIVWEYLESHSEQEVIDRAKTILLNEDCSSEGVAIYKAKQSILIESLIKNNPTIFEDLTEEQKKLLIDQNSELGNAGIDLLEEINQYDGTQDIDELKDKVCERVIKVFRNTATESLEQENPALDDFQYEKWDEIQPQIRLEDIETYDKYKQRLEEIRREQITTETSPIIDFLTEERRQWIIEELLTEDYSVTESLLQEIKDASNTGNEAPVVRKLIIEGVEYRRDQFTDRLKEENPELSKFAEDNWERIRDEIGITSVDTYDQYKQRLQNLYYQRKEDEVEKFLSKIKVKRVKKINPKTGVEEYKFEPVREDYMGIEDSLKDSTNHDFRDLLSRVETFISKYKEGIDVINTYTNTDYTYYYNWRKSKRGAVAYIEMYLDSLLKNYAESGDDIESSVIQKYVEEVQYIQYPIYPSINISESYTEEEQKVIREYYILGVITDTKDNVQIAKLLDAYNMLKDMGLENIDKSQQEKIIKAYINGEFVDEKTKVYIFPDIDEIEKFLYEKEGEFLIRETEPSKEIEIIQDKLIEFFNVRLKDKIYYIGEDGKKYYLSKLVPEERISEIIRKIVIFNTIDYEKRFGKDSDGMYAVASDSIVADILDAIPHELVHSLGEIGSNTKGNGANEGTTEYIANLIKYGKLGNNYTYSDCVDAVAKIDNIFEENGYHGTIYLTYFIFDGEYILEEAIDTAMGQIGTYDQMSKLMNKAIDDNASPTERQNAVIELNAMLAQLEQKCQQSDDWKKVIEKLYEQKPYEWE